MMHSLRALLSGVIDYAGLFPPARLEMGSAIGNYARYRGEPNRWSLGRFICPASRLVELSPFEELFLAGPPFVISALARGGKTTEEWKAGLRADLEAIGAFRQRYSEHVTVDVLEMRLPGAIVSASARNELDQLLSEVARDIESLGPPVLMPFLEMEFGDQWRQSLEECVAAISAANQAAFAQGRCRPAGFKLRTGGVEARAFPSAEEVAWVVKLCRDQKVAIKATAGLHHPVRRFDPEMQTFMHGFLNLFTAGVLAHTRRLGRDQIEEILLDECASDFKFDGDGMQWKTLRASVKEIEAARRSAIVSFGSCSFDEPCDDLRQLGLL
jgi:hypothetical protein